LIPPVDDEVLSFDIAEVTKPLAKGLRRVRVWRIQVHQDTDTIDLRHLLHLDSERRGEEAAGKGAQEGPPRNHRIS
jgi:hypothetical protein